MTREEQIKAQAEEWWMNTPYNYEFQEAFIAGAKWADETMLDKACDWLEEFMQMTPSKKTFIKRFKQAMKGE